MTGSAFDLLVTDVQLPGIDGASLAAVLRREHPRLPVLFVSGAVPRSLAVLLPEGAQVLAKPFTRDEFVSSVPTTRRSTM